VPKKPKKGRVGIRIDMTPMVDVAFLLLTFFMLTTQFRPPSEVDVVLPDSHSAIKLPESDVITVSINKVGTIYMGVDSQILRAKIFGEENKLKTDIQVDKSTLEQKLVQARVSNPKLRTVLKCDKDAEYGIIMDVMDILERVNITRFNLVTNLETTS
jgi:biopolymer transport protein ExbD